MLRHWTSGALGRHLPPSLNSRCRAASWHLAALATSIGGGFSISAARQASLAAAQNEEHVVIALGSNLGDRAGNLLKGLELLRREGTLQVQRHSCLYESAAAYVTDQPSFLNAAVLATTRLQPESLLRALKDVEEKLGRDFNAIRNGPRPLDLDIIFYGGKRFASDSLKIPHVSCEERDFVMAPVSDLLPAAGTKSSTRMPIELTQQAGAAVARWKAGGGEGRVGQDGLYRVVPLLQSARKPGSSTVLRLGHQTHIMGILNVTPDSFSDGGRLQRMEPILETADRMLDHGASILDIGGQSTRPEATRVSPEVEAGRVLPAIRAVKEELPEAVVSVDTFYAEVARAAVEAGADIVNDISGGTLDARMHSTVADLGVPYVLMHIRGDPASMQSEENTAYSNLVAQVAEELDGAATQAVQEGVSPWHIIVDPGIGFAKTSRQNFQLIRSLDALRASIEGLPYPPVLVGPSRKRFLGAATGHNNPADRDIATAAAVAACVSAGADIVRVHNVPVCRDAVLVADSIWRG